MSDLLKIKKICKDNNVKLLYACKFGSHLYGTNTPKSDTDYKGLFLPSKEQCFLQKVSKNITYSSGNKQGKNNENDIDIGLWSLQYFLELVSKGETNALDLLFSFTYPNMIIYKDNIMDNIFKHYKELFNIKNCNAYVGYAIGQAKKYGIKGSRLGVLKNVYKHLKEWIKWKGADNIKYFKLSDFLPEIINDENIMDSSYCFTKNINVNKNHLKEVNALVLCGKVHLESISISEFYLRLETEYKRYGVRAEKAERNEGIDWKALSHAVRALIQMKQLIKIGMIQYPLNSADELIEIKQGNTTFKEVEKRIYDEIEWIDNKLKDPELIIYNKRNNKLLESIVINAYEVYK